MTREEWNSIQEETLKHILEQCHLDVEKHPTPQEEMEQAADRYIDKLREICDCLPYVPNEGNIRIAFIEGAKWQAAIDIADARIDAFERLYINSTIEGLERGIRMCNYENLRLRTELKVIKDNQWISVEDRLPEEGQEVLVFSPNNGYMICAIHNGKWNVNEFCKGSKITHWMHIPEIRKEEV